MIPEPPDWTLPDPSTMPRTRAELAEWRARQPRCGCRRCVRLRLTVIDGGAEPDATLPPRHVLRVIDGGRTDDNIRMTTQRVTT